jgi:hypothetical protein
VSSVEERRLKALEVASARAAALAAQLDDGVEVASDHGLPAALLCAYYAVRTSRLLSAVVRLCEDGFGIESQSLLRSMLQDMADVRYVATDPGQLCESWREHESRRRYYVYTTHVDHSETEPPADFDDLEALIDRDWYEAKELAARRLHKSPANVSRTEARKYLLKDRWTRLSIRQAAEAADLKYPDTLELFRWYPYLSEHSHGSPAMARDYLHKQDGRPFIKAHPDPRFKSASMAIAALVYAHATTTGLRDIGLKCEPQRLIDDISFDGIEFGDL